MSNPNVNISNLDARYSKPADVANAISAQATTDAGQYQLFCAAIIFA